MPPRLHGSESRSHPELAPPPPAVSTLTDADRESLLALARRIDPHDAGAQNNLGVVFYRRGMLDEAAARFQQALELDPQLPVARRNLEIAHAGSGHYDRQITLLGERLRADPDDGDARHELARTYHALGRHDAAVDELQTLLSQRGPDPEVLIDLGLAERARGHVRAAREWLGRACALAPVSAAAHRQLRATAIAAQ